MQNTRDFKFQKLTPYENVEMNGYEQSLDNVFDSSNGDIRNVALTGIFGSGKSSVISTYQKKHPEKKFLHVSLAHFEGVTGEGEENNYDIDIEEKIINQLIQQIKPDDIPDSGFRIKRSVGWIIKLWWTIRVTLLLMILWYLSSWSSIHGVVDLDLCQWITNPISTGIIVVIGGVDLFLLLYSAISAVTTKKKIKNIKFVNTSIDIEDNSDKEKSYFDRHLDEILYLLVNSKADAIVFEDIDRFEDVDLKVLEHLRELCVLANSRMACSEKNSKVLRFIYLVSDDIFLCSEDRTKFFDYIIPVIPVIDASNSFNKLKEYLQKSGDYESLNERFLRGLSLYLDDLRTVKNIVNEYQIYSAKLASTAKDSNQLLAIITYKNLMPGDFSELQLGRGFIYKIFTKKSSLSKNRAQRINDDLKQCQERLAAIRNEHLVSVEELGCVDRDRNTYPNRYKDYTYSKWKNEIYNVRLTAINNKKDDGEKRINSKMMELKRELAHVNNLHLYQLITDDNEKEVIQLTEQDDGINIKLIKFLIRNGYIDETTYRDYIAFFYENGMSIGDKDFLIGVNSHDGKNYDYDLSNMNLIMQNLEPDDFLRPEIRNYGLIDHILESDLHDYTEKFVYQMQENTDYEYIAEQYRHTKHKDKYVRALCEYWGNSITLMISSENQAMSLKEVQEFVICCLASCNADIINSQNIEDRLTTYISNDFEGATCLKDECAAVRANLAVLKVEFIDLDKQIADADLRKAVYDSNLYVPNKDNIYCILKNEYSLDDGNIENRVLSAICSDDKQPLYSYVMDNINDVIRDIVLENEIVNEDAEIARVVIENDAVENELKDQFVNMLDYSFDSFEGFSDDQWKRIITFNAIVHTASIILQYFRKYKLTTELVEFINTSDDSIDYSDITDADDALLSEFWNECYRNNTIENGRYKEIAEQLGKIITNFNVPNMSTEKVKALFRMHLVSMTIQNLTYIRQNYPSLVVNYIESDANGYIAIATGNNFNANEALQAIESRNIDVESKKRLVSLVPAPISVCKKQYDDEVIEYILQNKIDVNELPSLLENYDEFSESAQGEIYRNLKTHVNVLKNNIMTLSKNKKLLEKLFADSVFSYKEKASLVDLLISNDCKSDLSLLLEKMDLSNFTKIVNKDSSRLPQIKKGDKEIAILTVLKNHGYIEGFESDKDSDTIRVERKKGIFK